MSEAQEGSTLVPRKSYILSFGSTFDKLLFSVYFIKQLLVRLNYVCFLLVKYRVISTMPLC
jgi:hypothetical protein